MVAAGPVLTACNVRTGNCTPLSAGSEQFKSLAVSADGGILAAGDSVGTVTLWSAAGTDWRPAGSWSHAYLERVMPSTTLLARLVPLGEITSGAAMVAGFWTPFFALVAFFMALNFQLASGALFNYSILTSGYGLPVLGSTLALAVGGVRLPWSIRSSGRPRAMKAKSG